MINMYCINSLIKEKELKKFYSAPICPQYCLTTHGHNHPQAGRDTVFPVSQRQGGPASKTAILLTVDSDAKPVPALSGFQPVQSELRYSLSSSVLILFYYYIYSVPNHRSQSISLLHVVTYVSTAWVLLSIGSFDILDQDLGTQPQFRLSRF